MSKTDDTTTKNSLGSDTDGDLTFSQKWTKTLKTFTKPLLTPFYALSWHAAKNPKLWIYSTIIASLGIVVLGLATNFVSETSDDIWTPRGSKPILHSNWVTDESGFPKDSRPSILILHRDGKNLFEDDGMAVESTRRMFQALDVYRQTPRYDELCAISDYIHPTTNQTTCQIIAATSYWGDSTESFEASIISSSDATSTGVVQTIMSAETYPSGGKVDFDQIIGYNEFDDAGILSAGKSFLMILMLPPDEDDLDNGSFAIDFEEEALDRILDLQDAWNAEAGNDIKIEILAERSFEDEFGRSLTKDLPLVPLVFIVMSVLCVVLFMKRDKVQSRSWVGFGAVATILLAIIFSFGFLFLCGVPFTSLTPLLPFILFGVGLDDSFIIYGAYSRTDPKKSPEDRIADTMEDIGATIFLTTLTSSLAFALGCVSSIPAVKYLVIYAFPTLMVDFLFQITFFVALIVIDQRRIEDSRRDCCFCCTTNTDGQQGDDDDNDDGENDSTAKDEVHFADRIMSRYADLLLQPVVQGVVIVLFTVMLAFFSWRTSKLHQFFDFTEVIPSDSYIQTWWDSYKDLYEANGVRAGVYFRDVDFSNPEIQQQMEDYVVELAAMPYSNPDDPFEFWLRDFIEFVSTSNDEELQSLTFEEQMDRFLSIPNFYDSYNKEIVRDANGVMTASRTLIRLDNVDEQDVLEVIDTLELQRSITENQSVNQGKNDWSFFTFTEDYFIWEFYRVSPSELTITTIIGTISVAVLALLFIPHWTAIFFVAPLVAILYIDLLGFIELCGLHVNPVMYISTVMSIGLMVDFVMHVTLRYVETTGTTRQAKTKETLETIGASVLVGGFSTLIGVLPLALSTSAIFWTTFVIFFGLVLLGLLHGLVLLPVLLSLFGPLDSIALVDDMIGGSRHGSAHGTTNHNNNNSSSDEGESSDNK